MTESLLKTLQDGCTLLTTLHAQLTRQHSALVSRQTTRLQHVAGLIEKSHDLLACHTAQCQDQLARLGYKTLVAWLNNPGTTLSAEATNEARSLHREYLALALQCQQQRDTNRWLLEKQSQVCQLYVNQLNGLKRQRYNALGQRINDRAAHKLVQS